MDASRLLFECKLCPMHGIQDRNHWLSLLGGALYHGPDSLDQMCIRGLDLGNPLGAMHAAESCAGICCTHNNNSRGNVIKPSASWLEDILRKTEFNSVLMSKWSYSIDVWT